MHLVANRVAPGWEGPVLRKFAHRSNLQKKIPSSLTDAHSSTAKLLAHCSGKRPAAKLSAPQRPLRPRFPTTSCQSGLASLVISRSLKTEWLSHAPSRPSAHMSTGCATPG
eukprot:5302318-Amphidinium_carterae.1